MLFLLFCYCLRVCVGVCVCAHTHTHRKTFNLINIQANFFIVLFLLLYVFGVMIMHLSGPLLRFALSSLTYLSNIYTFV